MERAAASPPRFPFGRNWRSYLRVLGDEHVNAAERSLEEMLGTGALRGTTFLDVGCGSGLFSLAAWRLGAACIHSFDCDPESVEVTRHVKRRFAPSAVSWQIEAGDVLDERYVHSLAAADVVYAWGVLHHTGQMWRALDNAIGLVAPGGWLWMAIYNDQGRRSRFWRTIKRAYNQNRWARWVMIASFVPALALYGALADTLRARQSPLLRYRVGAAGSRGMSQRHDLLDWLGGYPYEVARPEEVTRFCEEKGLEICSLRRSDGSGCNQFLFRSAR